MKRSTDFGFLHSSVCVNIKLQLQKSLKKTQNIIRFRKNNEQKNMNNHSVIPKFLICWLAVTEKGRNTELLRLRGCMWVQPRKFLWACTNNVLVMFRFEQFQSLKYYSNSVRKHRRNLDRMASQEIEQLSAMSRLESSTIKVTFQFPAVAD